MDWVRKMNSAIEYIESNLEYDIDIGDAAKIAGCSAYHFQRVFSYMANTTLAEYIRRRRLTLAAFDLQNPDNKVIDVAVKYGYDSPTSFTRAFSALHGITPSKAKSNGAAFISYPPISFKITIKGVSAMNYSIEKKDSFRVIGLRLKTNFHEDERSLKEIPPFWGQAHQSGDIKKIVSLMNTDIKGMFGICGVQIDESKDFYYYIAAASDAPMPDGMCEYTVPASTWAIFEGKGPMPVSIQELQRKIYTEWLPTSGYEYNTSAPDIEVYSDGDQSSPENKFWVWFPVIKK